MTSERPELNEYHMLTGTHPHDIGESTAMGFERRNGQRTAGQNVQLIRPTLAQTRTALIREGVLSIHRPVPKSDH